MTDIERLQAIRAQYTPGCDLPGAFYTSPVVFDADMRAVYGRHWLFIGHSSEIPAVGAFILCRVGLDELIVVRSSPTEVNAFLNVCRHRGSALVANVSGNRGEFVCPYHAWVYDLSGRLLSAPLMPADFASSRYSLMRFTVRELNGLLFVSFAEHPQNFAAIADAIGPLLEPHGLRHAKVCRTLTQTVAANWKIVAANSWECYHCAPAHKVFSHIMPYAQLYASADARERYEAIHLEWEVTANTIRVSPIEPVNGGIVWAKRYPVRAGFVTQSVDGKPVAPLMGSFRQYDRGVTGIQAFPAFWFSLCNDYALLTRIAPQGPRLTEVKYYWLVDSSASEGTDFDPARVAAFWSLTAREDLALCEANQRGVESSRYSPGRLSEPEVDVDRFIHWYLEQLDGAGTATEKESHDT
jgi:glycine betaine catabolism A